jgi:uncharacterized damage-inducible protein DinB
MADEELVRAIQDSRIGFLDSIEGLDEEATRRRPDPNEWSIIEVLAHMVAVDESYLGQAVSVTQSPGTAFTYFDDDAWKMAHPGPDEFVLSQVLAELSASHQRVLATAAALNEDELAIVCIHPRGIPYTVRDILARLPTHDQNHQRQIEQLRQLLGN